VHADRFICRYRRYYDHGYNYNYGDTSSDNSPAEANRRFEGNLFNRTGAKRTARDELGRDTPSNVFARNLLRRNTLKRRNYVIM